MCLARAIVTSVANLNKDMWTTSQLKDGFNKSRPLQGVEAKKLHEEAGVPISDHGVRWKTSIRLQNISEFKLISSMQIILTKLYIRQIPVRTRIFTYTKTKTIITSMPAFLAKDYYCHTCKKGYKCRNKHRCPNKCLSCFKTEQHTGDKIFCDECNRTFFGQKCYDKHLRNRSEGKNRSVVCELVQKCLECKRTVSDLKKHICGYVTCSNCKSYWDPKTHKCYMLSVETKDGACTNERRCMYERKTVHVRTKHRAVDP